MRCSGDEMAWQSMAWEAWLVRAGTQRRPYFALETGSGEPFEYVLCGLGRKWGVPALLDIAHVMEKRCGYCSMYVCMYVRYHRLEWKITHAFWSRSVNVADYVLSKAIDCRAYVRGSARVVAERLCLRLDAVLAWSRLGVCSV